MRLTPRAPVTQIAPSGVSAIDVAVASESPASVEMRRSVLPSRRIAPWREVANHMAPSRAWNTAFTPSVARSGGSEGACQRPRSKYRAPPDDASQIRPWRSL